MTELGTMVKRMYLSSGRGKQYELVLISRWMLLTVAVTEVVTRVMRATGLRAMVVVVVEVTSTRILRTGAGRSGDLAGPAEIASKPPLVPKLRSVRWMRGFLARWIRKLLLTPA